jgi:hypothetical protein
MRLSDLATVAFVVLAAGALLGSACRKPTAAPPLVPSSEIVVERPPEVVAIERRTLAKRQLAFRIVAERTPLLEAAEMFRRANGEDGMDRLARNIAMTGSIREKLCRQVIEYVFVAEAEMESAGHAPIDPPLSALFRDELDHRLVAGEFAPESK